MQATSNKGTASKIDKILLAVKRFCETMAIIVLFLMMSLTCVDVVARYFFNSPIKGAFELTEISLAILVFLSFPIAAIADSHIKVDLIADFGVGHLNLLVKLIAFSIGLGVFGVLTVQLWHHALKLQRYEQVTNSLNIPLYFVGLAAAGCCLLCVVVMIIGGYKKLMETR